MTQNPERLPAGRCDINERSARLPPSKINLHGRGRFRTMKNALAAPADSNPAGSTRFKGQRGRAVYWLGRGDHSGGGLVTAGWNRFPAWFTKKTAFSVKLRHRWKGRGRH